VPTWLFALVVLLFGVGLAFLVDRMKLWPRRGPYASRQRAERAKWLYYWFTGRFPSKEEEAADEAEAERLDAAERDAELKRKNRERKGE
jgi:hypothetical protein